MDVTKFSDFYLHYLWILPNAFPKHYFRSDSLSFSINRNFVWGSLCISKVVKSFVESGNGKSRDMSFQPIQISYFFFVLAGMAYCGFLFFARK